MSPKHMSWSGPAFVVDELPFAVSGVAWVAVGLALRRAGLTTSIAEPKSALPQRTADHRGRVSSPLPETKRRGGASSPLPYRRNER